MLNQSDINSLYNTGGWPLEQTGTLLDTRDGEEYNWIRIGEQVWMAENLNYDTAGAYCYGDNPSNCSIYGRLYKYWAAEDACPTGWHIPSDKEWQKLEQHLGMSDNDLLLSGWRGSIEGGKLKGTDTELWKHPMIIGNCLAVTQK